MKKIAITGCAGSGKSYLSLQLSKILNLPLYHLDKYYWKPNWIKADPEEFKKIHDTLCRKEKWIIDGSYIKYLDTRFGAADTIIFLDLPRRVCLYQAIKRSFLNWGKVTSTAPEQCPEKITLEFIKWIWNFNNKHHQSIMLLLDKYSKSKKIYVLKSRKEIDDFILELLIEQ